MSAFVELERQLADSVTARGHARRSLAIGGLGRWWRSRLGPSALGLAAVVVVIVVTIGRTGPSRSQPSTDAFLGGLTASATEGSCPPCRAVGGRLHGPLSEEAPPAGGHTAHRRREVLVRRGIPTVTWTREARSLR